MNVAIIDYGGGNLRSVANALRELGVQPVIAAAPEDLADTTHLVLPGVGSFGDCMAQLASRGLLPAIRDVGGRRQTLPRHLPRLSDPVRNQRGNPGRGRSRPAAGHRPPLPANAGPENPAHGLELGGPPPTRTPATGPASAREPYFYFVHSYFPVPADPALIAAQTTYGADTFAAAIERPNLFACQFHPEKSQDAGIRLIRNFLGI